jgi:acyl-CoA reductase-like NAD-dependent aldehyde dehydrogenase
LQEATAANDKPLGLRVVNVEPMVYSSAEKAVLELTQAGTPFEQVEQVIQQLPLDEEFKSMLWLFAWAEQPRAHRQAILHSVADQARARDRETASV